MHHKIAGPPLARLLPTGTFSMFIRTPQGTSTVHRFSKARELFRKIVKIWANMTIPYFIP